MSGTSCPFGQPSWSTNGTELGTDSSRAKSVALRRATPPGAARPEVPKTSSCRSERIVPNREPARDMIRRFIVPKPRKGSTVRFCTANLASRRPLRSDLSPSGAFLGWHPPAGGLSAPPIDTRIGKNLVPNRNRRCLAAVASRREFPFRPHVEIRSSFQGRRVAPTDRRGRRRCKLMVANLQWQVGTAAA